jgi:hypothetical protein
MTIMKVTAQTPKMVTAMRMSQAELGSCVSVA